MGLRCSGEIEAAQVTYFPGWKDLDKISQLRKLQQESLVVREPEPDPTRPVITTLHRHAGCGHDCLSGACGLTASKRDAMCPYCEMVLPDRRWSDGTAKF